MQHSKIPHRTLHPSDAGRLGRVEGTQEMGLGGRAQFIFACFTLLRVFIRLLLILVSLNFVKSLNPFVSMGPWVPLGPPMVPFGVPQGSKFSLFGLFMEMAQK